MPLFEELAEPVVSTEIRMRRWQSCSNSRKPCQCFVFIFSVYWLQYCSNNSPVQTVTNVGCRGGQGLVSDRVLVHLCSNLLENADNNKICLSWLYGFYVTHQEAMHVFSCDIGQLWDHMLFLLYFPETKRVAHSITDWPQKWQWDMKFLTWTWQAATKSTEIYLRTNYRIIRCYRLHNGKDIVRNSDSDAFLP